MSVDIPRKILVVDPGMAQIFGHNYGYNQILQRWFTEKQMQGSFLFSRLLPPQMLAEFPGSRAAFTWSPYLLLDPSESLRRIAETFAAELHFLVDADAETLIFAHTLNPTALYGFALWQAALPEARRSQLALNIMLDMSDSATCREALPSVAIFYAEQGRRGCSAAPRAAPVCCPIFSAPPVPCCPPPCRTAWGAAGRISAQTGQFSA